MRVRASLTGTMFHRRSPGFTKPRQVPRSRAARPARASRATNKGRSSPRGVAWEARPGYEFDLLAPSGDRCRNDRPFVNLPPQESHRLGTQFPGRDEVEFDVLTCTLAVALAGPRLPADEADVASSGGDVVGRTEP